MMFQQLTVNSLPLTKSFRSLRVKCKLRRFKEASALVVLSVNCSHRGFTLIELLVVFSIISVISAVSIASFVDYSRNQALKTATQDVIALLEQAKSRAQSQVKPSGCGTNPLEGYGVRVCGLSGSACSVPNTYELVGRCGTDIVVATRKLPENILFSDTGTTSKSFTFRVISGGVEGEGSLVVQGDDLMQIINVTEEGAISTQ